VEEARLEGVSVAINDNEAPGLIFSGWAGAVLMLGQTSTLNFTDSEFSRNLAGVAGAIWINSGKTQFTRCTFQYNSCRSGGFGGAVVPEGDSQNVFQECEFRNNFGVYGGAIDDGTTAVSLFRKCKFRNNRAVFGGSYYAFASSRATFEECHFRNESAVNTGGCSGHHYLFRTFKLFTYLLFVLGVSEVTSGSSPVFLNCVFEGNRASASNDLSVTGGIITKVIGCKFLQAGDLETSSASSPSYVSRGGHIGAQSTLLVRDSTFEDGFALQGGAIYIRSATNVTIESSTFRYRA